MGVGVGQAPLPVHRLNRPTSASLRVTKDMPTRIALGELLAQRLRFQHPVTGVRIEAMAAVPRRWRRVSRIADPLL